MFPKFYVVNSKIVVDSSTIKNSFDFIKKIKDTVIPENHVLVSFDVVSMFTNIKKEMVIEALDRRFSEISQNCDIPHADIIDTVKLIFDNTFFSFNNMVYKQKSGCPMGSSISSFFANIVLEDLEKHCLNSLSFSPVFDYRYVDDIIMCIPKDKIEETLKIFNRYNPKLQFTCEVEHNDQLNFLDVSIIKKDQKLIFDWYQKPSFSGRILNFNSNHPKHQKVAMVYNLVDRAILLSDICFHSKNLKIVEKILTINSYPAHFYKKFIQKRLHYLSDKNIVSQSKNRRKNTKKMTPIKVPYKDGFFKKLKHLFQSHDLTAVPELEKNLASIVRRGKDATPKFEKTGVVYRIPCTNCIATYVGQTKRSLIDRLKEHQKDVRENKDSSILQVHCSRHHHHIDWEKTSILDCEPAWFPRLVSEMIQIKLQPCALNRNEDTRMLARQYSAVLEKLKQ